MRQELIHIALVVRDYDEAIDFYVNKLNFELLEDSYQSEQNKRWVVIAPPGSKGATILLAKATTEQQMECIGKQTGGRVFLFLCTDDFWRDHDKMVKEGIEFIRPPTEQDYGTVAVFCDLYGNLWDLLQLKQGHSVASRFLD
ncbi:VOC family protein [Pseudoalteromonas sp. T1lg23B]|uniref:VOC family protein n=1 Tax=Pseudoalteromonas sp. T1lg23B TaxID=2077097 RepID=UPI000CF7024C|nr:VOC family protein [Pseudoalteromonas sp. T1lg23B]